MILFNGIVSGERGTCLVVAVADTKSRWVKHMLVMTADLRFINLSSDIREEDLTWVRINER